MANVLLQGRGCYAYKCVWVWVFIPEVISEVVSVWVGLLLEKARIEQKYVLP